MRFLLAETVELRFAQATLEVCASVCARGCVTLIENLIATTGVVLTTEEVIETDFIK
jgi:hypothetical protein